MTDITLSDAPRPAPGPSGAPLPMGLKLYRALTSAAGPLAGAVLSYRLKRGKEDPARINERRGVAGAPRPDAPLIWIHGASVGESLSVLPLIERLAERRPDLRILVTTGTVTSARLMAERLPKTAQHQFAPVDRPAYVHAFLDSWRPELAIFLESEFWPNMILETRRRGAALALINGRISPETYRKWMRRPAFIRRLLTEFDLRLAQDGKNAERLTELSRGPVGMLGNLKLAAPPLPVEESGLDALRAAVGDRPVWLASSTHPGEEAIIAAAQKELMRSHPELLCIIVPRHPERGAEIASELSDHGLRVGRRAAGELPMANKEVYVGDTLGELGLFYRLSDIVLVGGSLVPKGGHNPLEPARLRAAILHGPHTYNFVETYADMRAAGGAALVRNKGDLAAAVTRLLADEKTRYAMAAAAMNAAETSAERVLTDILEALDPLMPPAGGRRTAAA
ncbi:MAG: 3-deoxy-D-manno-octulosonic acid transferase [Pseudomonadota bacterium]